MLQPWGLIDRWYLRLRSAILWSDLEAYQNIISRYRKAQSHYTKYILHAYSSYSMYIYKFISNILFHNAPFAIWYKHCTVYNIWMLDFFLPKKRTFTDCGSWMAEGYPMETSNVVEVPTWWRVVTLMTRWTSNSSDDFWWVKIMLQRNVPLDNCWRND